MTAHRSLSSSRRRFLTLVAKAFGIVSLSGGGVSGRHSSPPALTADAVVRLNPAFRLRCLSDGQIELFTHLADGSELIHTFTGLEADVLRRTEKGEPLCSLVDAVSSTSGVPSAACRTEVATLLEEYRRAGLVYTGDLMFVTVREIIHG